MSAGETIRWRDRIAIAHHELLCVCVVICDVLDRRTAAEPDWGRLTLALHRLRALMESP